MLSALLFLLTVATGAWAWTTAPRAAGTRVPGFLRRLVGLFALQHLLLQLGRWPALAALSPALAVGTAVTGLALWAHVAWLSAYGPRTKAWWVRAAFAALATFVALAHAPWQALAAMTVPAVLVYGWRSALATRQLFAAAMAMLAALLFALWGFGGPHGNETANALQPAAHFAQWANVVALAYLLLAVFKSLAAFVRDPSLGIRAVRRRLALSHLLVSIVPLALLAGMWIVTTWLGVTADRAASAQRALEAEGGELHAALAQALATDAPATGGVDSRAALGAADADAARTALAAMASAHRAQWPGARAWSVRAGRAERVVGDSVELERALPVWAANLDSLPAAGVVELAGRRWLGAVARDSAGGRAAIALVPIEQALRSGATRAVEAQLVMRARAAVPDSGDAVQDEDPGLAQRPRDSARVDAARRLTRRAGAPDSAARPRVRRRRGHVTLTTARDTVQFDDAPADSMHSSALALVRGMTWRDGRWRRQSFQLGVHTTFGSTVLGLYRNVSANPFNMLPILALAALVALLIPVALFNFRLVRQLGRSFLQPVAALRTGTQALAASQFDHRIALQGDDELWDAARAFNQMSDGLARARELEKERDRLEHELDLARRIQQRLLPAGPPDVAGLEIAGVSEPAREVGGDYYDHIPLGDDRVLLVIADVSGKGVPAALLMSAFRASLMSQDALRIGPAAVASHLNDFLHRSVEPGKFVTAFVGFLDGRTGHFVYANAGHNPPVLRRRDGRVEWLATGGLILGIVPDTRFESGDAQLEPGDLLALYTDGVTEGADAANEQFGEERLVESLSRLAGRPCGEIAHAVVREVRAFEGEQGPADDITLLVARRHPA